MSYDERMAPDNGLTEPIPRAMADDASNWPEQAPSQSPAGPFAPPEIQRQGVDEKEIPKQMVDPDCRKCFGRGFSARFQDGSALPCSCVMREMKRRHLAMLRDRDQKPEL